MSDFRKKKKIRKLVYSKLSLLILFSVLVFLSFPTFNIYKKYRESLENKNGALGELESLEQRNNELSARLERLGTERGLEEEIRKKFNVAKEGEGVVVIVSGTNTAESQNTAGGKNSFFDKLREFWERF